MYHSLMEEPMKTLAAIVALILVACGPEIDHSLDACIESCAWAAYDSMQRGNPVPEMNPTLCESGPAWCSCPGYCLDESGSPQ